jgi:hypothetical protein
MAGYRVKVTFKLLYSLINLIKEFTNIIFGSECLESRKNNQTMIVIAVS